MGAMFKRDDNSPIKLINDTKQMLKNRNGIEKQLKIKLDQ